MDTEELLNRAAELVLERKHYTCNVARLDLDSCYRSISPGVGKLCPVHIGMQRQRQTKKHCPQRVMKYSLVSDMRMFLFEIIQRSVRVCNRMTGENDTLS